MAGISHETPRPLSAASVEMVAIDMDGTLLHNDRTIGPESIAAIEQARREGVLIVIATARPPRSVLKAYQQLKLDTWQVNHNGALIYDQHQLKSIDHQPIDGAVARRVVQLARQEAADIPIGVEVINTLYTDRVDDTPEGSHVGVTSATGSLEEVLARPVTKIFMTGHPGQLGHIRMALQAKLLGKIDFAISHLRLLQVVCAGVDKAPALEKTAEHYGIARESVMAIGDAPNDLGMMKWAGLSVAVKNAWSDVRQAAHFVVGSNDEDGVAEAIRKYALN